MVHNKIRIFWIYSFFYFVFIYVLYICMFPACCFRQRTCVAQGLLKGILNETWTHSCIHYKWFLSGHICFIRVYVLLSWSMLTLVSFTLLWYLIYPYSLFGPTTIIYIYIYIYIYRTLLEKWGRAHKWCTPMDPFTWPSKVGTTSSNLHTVALWGYRV